MKRKGKSYLLALAVILALVLSGCQTAALQEDQEVSASREQEESGSTEASAKRQEESRTEQEKQEETDTDELSSAGAGEGNEEGSGSHGASAEAVQTDSGIADGTQSASAETSGGTQTEPQSEPTRSPAASEENDDTDSVPEGKPEPVEPQETTAATENRLTCTLLVECSTILNNMDNLESGKESLVPSDGIIYGPATVVFYEGESVYDVLLREMQSNHIHMEAEYTPAYNSAYIDGINNLYEFDCGRWSGWMYCVNGWYPNYGASRYQVRQGDVIEWHYTCDLGRDLGQDVSDWQ